MTPEQMEYVLEWAREITRDDEPDGPSWRRLHLARALLAEHDRAERLAKRVRELGDELDIRDEYLNANEKDAQRWRAVRGQLLNQKWADIENILDRPDEDEKYTTPATVDEAADRLILEKEKNANPS